MSTTPPTERYRRLPLQVQIFGLVLCTALTIAAMSTPYWIVRVLGLVTGCWAIVFLFFPETHIDFQRGVITDMRRLLGVVPVWQRRRAKDEFACIKCYRLPGEIDDTSDIWIVALQPRSGDTIDLRRFSVSKDDGDFREMQVFARELSEQIGLDVIRDDS